MACLFIVRYFIVEILLLSVVVVVGGLFRWGTPDSVPLGWLVLQLVDQIIQTVNLLLAAMERFQQGFPLARQDAQKLGDLLLLLQRDALLDHRRRATRIDEVLQEECLRSSFR